MAQDSGYPHILHSALTELSEILQDYIKRMNHALLSKDKIITDLKNRVDEIELTKNLTEEKAIYNQKMLYLEMNKVDKIQMELELATRERDIALRKQGITNEQKQLLVKMEHEGYKINETLERIEHISDMIKELLETEALEELA